MRKGVLDLHSGQEAALFILCEVFEAGEVLAVFLNFKRRNAFYFFILGMVTIFVFIPNLLITKFTLLSTYMTILVLLTISTVIQ